MKISQRVTYHSFDDKIFIHTALQKNLILDGDAEEILNYVTSHPNCTTEEVCKFFVSQYDDEDAAEVESGIKEFIENTLKENIFCENMNNPLPLRTVFEEVEDYFRKNNKLFSLTVEVTYRCVEKCIYCYIDDSTPFCVKDELTFEDYKKFFIQARKIGCVRILLTGGKVFFCALIFATLQNTRFNKVL